MSLLDFAYRSPKVVVEFVRTRFDDEKLAQVSAFNEDGKMSFFEPCCCLLGVASSTTLHVSCRDHHYWRLAGSGYCRVAEAAYWSLGSPLSLWRLSGGVMGLPTPFHVALRRRRFAKILREETARRDRLEREWRENRGAIFAALAKMDEELTRREEIREFDLR